MSKTKLTELRDELAEESWMELTSDDNNSYSSNDVMKQFQKGFDAAIKAQAAQCDEAIEFSHDAVTDWINNTEVEPGDIFKPSIHEAARWQHSQNRAALSAMKGELGQRSQATIDKAIAASKLPSDKPSIFADVEFVDNGNNSYLKSKGAAQTMALHILEEQIEKLSAEKANEWKRMDEAKDAFACTVDQLNAAVDQQAIEIDKLRETLSAMNSLATKYRNNCDMLMQHRGVFKDEIQKLRAENAILRDALCKLQNDFFEFDHGEHPADFKACYEQCEAALTAADKVRGE